MRLRMGSFQGMVAALAVCASAVAAQAGTVYSASIAYSEYGHLDQSGVDMPLSTDPLTLGGGGNSCVPTAVTNSFVFLQNHYASVYGTSLVPGTAEAAAEDLGRNYMGTTSDKGTFVNGWIDGKYNYMEAKAAGKTAYAAQVWNGNYTGGKAFVTNGNPTWEFLYNALKGYMDIELGIIPAVDGIGHAITLSSFTWCDSNNDGIIDKEEDATLDFIDPGSPGALSYMDIWQSGAGGQLKINSGKYDGYSIVLAISETAVPLPPAAYAGLGLLAGIALMRRIRRRRAASAFDTFTTN